MVPSSSDDNNSENQEDDGDDTTGCCDVMQVLPVLTTYTDAILHKKQVEIPSYSVSFCTYDYYKISKFNTGFAMINGIQFIAISS